MMETDRYVTCVLWLVISAGLLGSLYHFSAVNCACLLWGGYVVLAALQQQDRKQAQQKKRRWRWRT